MIYFLIFLSFGLSVTATGILLPLYVYPGTNAVAWNSLKSAITAYPSVQWQIIINPANGPGTNPSSPYPDSNYITGIKALNAYQNVKTLGYVHTSYGQRSYNDIHADINNYTNWSSYTKGNISMGGIFFDEVPSIYDCPNGSIYQASNGTYLKNIATYASSTIPSRNANVVFNPGNPAPGSFFNYSNTVVGFENTYAAYKDPTTLKAVTSNGGKMAQTAVLMHDAPKSLTTSTINTLIGNMKKSNVGFVYLGNNCCYNALNVTLLTALASACNNA